MPFVIWWHNQHQSYPLRPWLYHVRFPNWTDLEKEEPNLVKVKLPSVVSQLSFFCSFFVLYGIHVCILAPILIIDTLMWGPGLRIFVPPQPVAAKLASTQKLRHNALPTHPALLCIQVLHYIPTSATHVFTSIARCSSIQCNCNCSAIRSYDWVQCDAVLVQLSSI